MTRIPLALLPGTLCNAELWTQQCAALQDIAEICIINTAQHDTLDRLAVHLHSLMPKRFAVAGLSYGGIVALAVWRHSPQAISHLGLLDTTPFPITSEKRANQEALMAQALSGGFERVATENADNLMKHLDQPDEPYRVQLQKMARQVGANGFANQIKAQIGRPDSRPILSKIECPTLVLCGEQDIFCPPEIHRRMAEQISNSRLHIVPKCGHLSTLEEPEYVSQAMRDWLQSPTLFG